MNRFFLVIIMMLLPFVPNKQAFANDLSGNIGISLYGGVNLPTNGNISSEVKTTDFLKVGPQFGLGVSYYFTEGFGVEAIGSYGYNFYKDDYKIIGKEPVLSNLSVSLDAVYDFGHLFGNSIISPFARAGVGIYNWSHFEDGLGSDFIKINNEENKATSFGFNVGIGVDFIAPCDSNFRVGLLVDYNMYFPKDEAKFGKDFAEQGTLTPQIRVSYYIPTK